MPWPQNYDPLGNPWLSTALAALPVVVLLGLLAWGHLRAWLAALLALAAALGVALLGFGMPVKAAGGRPFTVRRMACFRSAGSC